ncbi:hypothetical protein [Novosphingobium sp. MBES04]|nr:hypothetical protein [Novosphingobium sp. MBES04]
MSTKSTAQHVSEFLDEWQATTVMVQERVGRGDSAFLQVPVDIQAGRVFLIAPSPHAIGAMLIAVTAFWFFASGRVRIEIVSLVLIAVLAISAYFFPIEHDGPYTGLEIAFGGFGHEALIAICALMILGRELVVTGALEPAGRLLTRLWKFSRLLGLEAPRVFRRLRFMRRSFRDEQNPEQVFT